MDVEIIERIINSKKLNYNKMTELVSPYIEGGRFRGNTNNNNVTIYIDINNVIKQLYSPQVSENFTHLKTKNRLNLVVELVNIIGHYRHFFASRLNMHSRFFLFYSDKESIYHTSVDPDYKKEYYKKMNEDNITYRDINKTISITLELVKTIVKYIPNAYYIDTYKIEPTILPYYIMEKTTIDNENDYSLIVSNDKIYRQLLDYKDRLLLLELRGSEKSKVISKENIKGEIFSSSTKKDINDFMNIDSGIIDIFNLFSDHKDQEYKSISGYGPVTTIKLLDKMIEDTKLSPLKEYNNETLLRETFKDYLKEEKLEELIKRFKLFDQKHIVDEIDGSKIQNILSSQIIDFNDPLEIKRLNDELFINSFINIDYLFEGEINRN
ncbi:hypothetical protein [Staphylococcus phage vB_StaM_PB50]|nr:hypothetical protein [Staphylococcus phage vB_StaM_PB50]